MAENDVYTALAERHGFGSSPRYRKVLQFLMTPQQANLVAQLPMAPEELAAKEGLPVDEVKATLEELFKKGVIFPRNFYTREHFRFARHITQIHDATESLDGIDLYTDEQKKELWELWWDFVRNEWEPQRMPELAAAKSPPLRIIPAWKAIKDIPGVLPAENMAAIIEEANLISVVSCSCRKRKEAFGDPCARSHDMNCIQFNRSAEYTEGRGHGHLLSKEEALRMIEETEDDGLIHQWPNADLMTTNTLCNCCVCCCMNFLPMSEYKVPWTAYYAKSRFEAANDVDACTGCQDCIERCQFDALSMQKLPGHKRMKAVVNPENCMGCGVCVLVCEPQSLKMKLVRPPEHIPQLRREPEGAHSHGA
jgi:NAD-dependent dihydropyrimidine dehydrogenase PreA subunit